MRSPAIRSDAIHISIEFGMYHVLDPFENTLRAYRSATQLSAYKSQELALSMKWLLLLVIIVQPLGLGLEVVFITSSGPERVLG